MADDIKGKIKVKIWKNRVSTNYYGMLHNMKVIINEANDIYTTHLEKE